MPTKAEIIRDAVAAGYGSAEDLTKDFAQCQKVGIVGRAIGRTHRQGGEGVWHDGQRTIFLWKMEQERVPEGGRLTTIVNMPVGAWLLGWPGVELPQARRAFGYWVRHRAGPGMPSGERSLRHEGIQLFVARVAAPGSMELTRRTLRDALGRIYDQQPDIDIDAELPRLRRALLAVVPVGSTASLAEKRDIDRYVQDLRLMATAQLRLHEVLNEAPAGRALWEAARTAAQRRYADRSTDSGDTPLSKPMTRNGFLNSGCDQLLIALGLAFAEASKGPKA